MELTIGKHLTIILNLGQVYTQREDNKQNNKSSAVWKVLVKKRKQKADRVCVGRAGASVFKGKGLEKALLRNGVLDAGEEPRGELCVGGVLLTH